MFDRFNFRAFCHATEELDRVKQALARISGGEVQEEARGRGHFGNPIIIMKVEVVRKREVRAAWERISSQLDLNMLHGELDDRLDESNVFHLRFDKQRAYLGDVITISPGFPGDVIDMRAKVVTHPRSRDAAIRFLTELCMSDQTV